MINCLLKSRYLNFKQCGIITNGIETDYSEDMLQRIYEGNITISIFIEYFIRASSSTYNSRLISYRINIYTLLSTTVIAQKQIVCGVPQGSALGSLLYSVNLCSTIHNYANDTACYNVGEACIICSRV